MPRQAPDVALYIIKSLAIKKAQDYITSGSVLTIDEEIIKAFCPYQKEAQSFLTHFIKEVERDLKRHDIGIYVKRLAIKRGLRQAYAGYDFNEKHVWHEATSLPGYEAIYFNEYKSAFDGYIPKKAQSKESRKKRRGIGQPVHAITDFVWRIANIPKPIPIPAALPEAAEPQKDVVALNITEEIKNLATKKAKEYLTQGRVLILDEEKIINLCNDANQTQNYLTCFIEVIKKDLQKYGMGTYVKRFARLRAMHQFIKGFFLDQTLIREEAQAFKGYEALYFNEYIMHYNSHLQSNPLKKLRTKINENSRREVTDFMWRIQADLLQNSNPLPAAALPASDQRRMILSPEALELEHSFLDELLNMPKVNQQQEAAAPLCPALPVNDQTGLILSPADLEAERNFLHDYLSMAKGVEGQEVAAALCGQVNETPSAETDTLKLSRNLSTSLESFLLSVEAAPPFDSSTVGLPTAFLPSFKVVTQNAKELKRASATVDETRESKLQKWNIPRPS